MYKRALLKLSVEALAAGRGFRCGRRLHPRSRKEIADVLDTGLPYFSTETAASLRAMEIVAEVLLKATSWTASTPPTPSSSPTPPSSRRAPTWILQKGLRVMEETAVSMCNDNKLPMIIFSMCERGNICRVVMREKLGTLVIG